MNGGETALLEFLPEPTMVLDVGGRIHKANRAAARLMGIDPRGRKLTDLCASGSDRILDYLERCSGTASPMVGAASLLGEDGEPLRVRLHAARISDGPEGIMIALRCTRVVTDEFSILARQVRELNREVLLRSRAQAGLEESLRGNQVLLRELHHRVKNNIQTVLSLFSAARRDSDSDDVRAFVDDASRRLVAIGAAQRVIYETQEFTSVSSERLIAGLCKALGDIFGERLSLNCSVTPGQLASEMAFPLALIINELVTNVVKHAARDGASHADMRLERDGDRWTLTLRDKGLGIPAGALERRSSGVGLVRGLCRQIGGSIEMANDGGAVVVIRFKE